MNIYCSLNTCIHPEITLCEDCPKVIKEPENEQDEQFLWISKHYPNYYSLTSEERKIIRNEFLKSKSR